MQMTIQELEWLVIRLAAIALDSGKITKDQIDELLDFNNPAVVFEIEKDTNNV